MWVCWCLDVSLTRTASNPFAGLRIGALLWSMATRMDWWFFSDPWEFCWSLGVSVGPLNSFNGFTHTISRFFFRMGNFLFAIEIASWRCAVKYGTHGATSSSSGMVNRGCIMRPVPKRIATTKNIQLQLYTSKLQYMNTYECIWQFLCRSTQSTRKTVTKTVF